MKNLRPSRRSNCEESASRPPATEGEGDKQKTIKESEARRQQQVNEAEGEAEAEAILAVARATAEGLRQVAAAISSPGGVEATQLRVAEQYIERFGQLAQRTNTMILPANVADVASMVGTAMKVFQEVKPADGPPQRRAWTRPRLA